MGGNEKGDMTRWGRQMDLLRDCYVLYVYNIIKNSLGILTVAIECKGNNIVNGKSRKPIESQI